jgi:hypothetical protein
VVIALICGEQTQRITTQDNNNLVAFLFGAVEECGHCTRRYTQTLGHLWIGKAHLFQNDDLSFAKREFLDSSDLYLHAGKARDEAGVDAFLKNVRALGAESIPPKEDDESVYGFYPAAESWRLELGFRDGTNLVLDSGATKSEGSGWFAIVNYYVRISDLSDIVFVGEFDIDGLRDDIDDILR